jgi:MYXO-CTERM domain-containing protein
MLQMKRLRLALLLLLVSGCSAPPSLGVLAQPIINGSVDDADTNVVLVILTYPGLSSWGALCSGEIVSPHVVLTAAHCVSPFAVGSDAQFSVFAGTALPMSGLPPPDQLLQVRETHYDKAFDHQTTAWDADDIAVLILAAPTKIAPLPYNHFNLPASNASQPVRLVGYGITSGTDRQGTTAGTRHQAPSYLVDTQAQTMTIWDNLHSNCEGDSGGPTLMMLDGRERIVGITQTGYSTCPLNLAQIDTRVDAYADFIDQYVKQFDPPRVPAGGACTSDDECAPFPCLEHICTQQCAGANATCPTGTRCVDVDGRALCKSAGGCAVAGAGGDGPPLLFGLVLVAWLVRRRRRNA